MGKNTHARENRWKNGFESTMRIGTTTCTSLNSFGTHLKHISVHKCLLNTLLGISPCHNKFDWHKREKTSKDDEKYIFIKKKTKYKNSTLTNSIDCG